MYDTNEQWRNYLGSLDDYKNPKCKISGLAILSNHDKILYSSGWLNDLKTTVVMLTSSLRRIDLQEQQFVVFSKTNKTTCAITKGRRIGLIVHKLNENREYYLIISYHWPQMIEQVYSYLQKLTL